MTKTIKKKASSRVEWITTNEAGGAILDENKSWVGSWNILVTEYPADGNIDWEVQAYIDLNSDGQGWYDIDIPVPKKAKDRTKVKAVALLNAKIAKALKTSKYMLES